MLMSASVLSTRYEPGSRGTVVTAVFFIAVKQHVREVSWAVRLALWLLEGYAIHD